MTQHPDPTWLAERLRREAADALDRFANAQAEAWEEVARNLVKAGFDADSVRRRINRRLHGMDESGGAASAPDAAQREDDDKALQLYLRVIARAAQREARLREALERIAGHSVNHSDFPHSIEAMQNYARAALREGE